MKLLGLFIALGAVQFAGCYTTTQSLGINSPIGDSLQVAFEDLGANESIIEGTIDYVRSEGGTVQSISPSGFVLRDCHWIFKAPDISTDLVWLIGALDNSYIKKCVRLVGTFQTFSAKNPNWQSSYSSRQRFAIRKMQIIY